MTFYRVVEICKAYDSFFGEGQGWVYCSNGFLDYKQALEYAIDHDRHLPWNKTWVEADYMEDSEYSSVPDYWWHKNSRYNIF